MLTVGPVLVALICECALNTQKLERKYVLHITIIYVYAITQ